MSIRSVNFVRTDSCNSNLRLHHVLSVGVLACNKTKEKRLKIEILTFFNNTEWITVRFDRQLKVQGQIAIPDEREIPNGKVKEAWTSFTDEINGLLNNGFFKGVTFDHGGTTVHVRCQTNCFNALFKIHSIILEHFQQLGETKIKVAQTEGEMTVHRFFLNAAV